MKSLYIFCISIFCSLHLFSQTAAGGWGHVLYICNDKTVRACGYNYFGQLGDGSGNNSMLPVVVSNMTNAKAVRAGFGFSAALKYDSTVWTWGDNQYGQLGNGTSTYSNIPVQVSITGVKKIAAGTYHCMVLKNDGTVWGWGNDTSGQLGNGSIISSHIPVQTSNMNNVKDVEAGTWHTLALKNDGTVWAWGKNDNGELGNGSGISSNIPVQVTGLSNVVGISAGQHFSVAVKADGSVWTWGYNFFGSLGKPASVTGSNVPVQVDSLSEVREVSTGCFQLHTVAIKNDGSLWAWGNNDYGELGVAAPPKSYYAIPVPGFSNIKQVVTGNVNTIVTKSDNSYWIAGWNAYGQLGNNTTIDSYTFLQSTGLCFGPNGVQELTVNDLSLYPVPAREYFNIEFREQQEHTLIEVCDLSGRILNRYDCNGGRITINTSGYNSGLYVIRFSQNGVLMASRKMTIE